MALTGKSYHQRSLYRVPEGSDRAAKRLYTRRLAGETLEFSMLATALNVRLGKALGMCSQGPGGSMICLFSLMSDLLPAAFRTHVLLWQSSRALEGVAQDPLHLAVGAAHLIVGPALDGLPYGGVYAKGVLLACHDVLSYRAEMRVAGKPQFRDCP